MKQYKKFIYIFLSIFLGFIAYNFLVWNFYTKDLILGRKNYTTGDEARLSYYKKANELRVNKIDLPEKHIEMEDYKGQKIDIITIGDSFSQGLSGGLNPFYQDYLATYKNLTVLNIKQNQPALEYLILLLNNGFIDKVKPKAVLLETVERQVGEKYSLENFDNVVLETKKSANVLTNTSSFFNFINEANFRAVLFDILYHFTDTPPIGEVYIKKTSQPLFSNFVNKILFLKSEIELIKSNSPEKLKKTNDNLNKISDILAKRDIKLYFMPVVDKYDLYYNYILNNPFPRSNFFEELRKYDKKYVLIDTKVILEKEVNKGVKDIFYKDDTHWSYKASSTVVKNINFIH